MLHFESLSTPQQTKIYRNKMADGNDANGPVKVFTSADRICQLNEIDKVRSQQTECISTPSWSQSLPLTSYLLM
jgi:hypothetical protein